MSKSSLNNTNSTLNKSLSDDFDNVPCVQYGFPQDKGPVRTPKLQTIFDPIPDGAETASPVYLPTVEEYNQQADFETGYEVAGYTSKATEIQEKCETDGRVLYPVHIESDAYHKEGPGTLIAWFREFVKDYLEVSFHSCTVYFSGNRSIHVHVPRFVSGEEQREQLRELAQTFCSDKGADLDCGLYDPKRMFRLPGVKHQKTGLHKTEINPEWDHNHIFRESREGSTSDHKSYESILRRVFATQPSLTIDSPQTTLDRPYDLFQVLDADKTILELDSDNRGIDVPVIEEKQYPENLADEIKWLQYNAKEFSPYALASGNDRSVAIIRVKGGAFAREDVRNGATLVPAYFHAARGCAGEEFTKADEHAPLQLSVPDYRTWEHAAGDHVVIVGGKSRNSRVFSVTSQQATNAGQALTGDNGSREKALSYLDSEGFDVGEAGTDRESKHSATSYRRKNADHVPRVRAPSTEAATLQQQAEQQGIQTLTHEERWRVACRVLHFGWEPAWQWFKKQFGGDFEPDITRKQLRSVVETFPDDYRNVALPQ